MVSQTCVTGAGDETAPQPDPSSAVDELREVGTVDPLPAAANKKIVLNVEAVAPDGTLWALQNGKVLKAEPDGPFTIVDTPFGKDELRGADDVVDLALADDGTAYLAAPQAVAALDPSGRARLIAGALVGGTAPTRVYADQKVPNVRPALGQLLPTVTGITVKPDATVIVLALDTVLAAGVPYGDDVLLYDGAGGRILRMDDTGRLTRVAGGTADKNGFSDFGECGGRDQWGPDGSRVLAIAAGQGVVRLGLER